MSDVPQPRPDSRPAISPFKGTSAGRGSLRRIINATRYSARGLRYAWAHERAFREEVWLALVLVPLACWLPVTPVARAVLIASVVLVLILELVNSAIEAAVDRVSIEHHVLSGAAKDLGSAAVMLALLLCGMVWLVIVGPLLWAALPLS